MKMFFFIFSLLVIFLQCESGTNFHFNRFYFEMNHTIYESSLIKKDLSLELLKQIPLENKKITYSENKISIMLNEHLHQNGDDLMHIIQKGDIYTDGDHLILYFGDSYEIINDQIFSLLGHMDDIDEFLINFPGNIHNKLDFKVLCESSIIRTDKIVITKDNPEFFVFNKESLNFDEVPNLYFEKNGEPLYPHCSINKNKKYEIRCSFTEEEIKNYYFKSSDDFTIFEIIQGCKEKVQTQLIICFNYEIPHCTDQTNKKCFDCKSKKYKPSYDGKKCKATSFFYFMVIGLPILDIFLIVLFACFWTYKNELEFLIPTAGVFSILNFVLFLVYFT